MFTGFTKQTSEFLWDLAFNNERPWFLEHKEEFERVVNTPFKALAQDTVELMETRWPEKDFRVHISRIYRDARRLFGRGPYKDHLWFSVKSGSTSTDGPMFWFEVGRSDFSYGMGFYTATAAHMEAFRKMIDANPARFERIAAPIMKNRSFHVFGEEYKRPKGTHEGDIIDFWYNRKRIGIDITKDFGKEVLDEKLPEILTDCYAKLMPMYEFFLEFYNSVPIDDKRR